MIDLNYFYQDFRAIVFTDDYPNSLDGSLWMVGIIIEWVSLPCSCTIKWWNEFHSIVSLDIEPDQILAV